MQYVGVCPEERRGEPTPGQYMSVRRQRSQSTNLCCMQTRPAHTKRCGNLAPLLYLLTTQLPKSASTVHDPLHRRVQPAVGEASHIENPFQGVREVHARQASSVKRPIINLRPRCEQVEHTAHGLVHRHTLTAGRAYLANACHAARGSKTNAL